MRDLPLPTLPYTDLRPAGVRRAVSIDSTPTRLDVAWARTDDDVRQADRKSVV